jgi:predicted kinase
MSIPLLVFIGGKPGSGKSTQARRLAETDALGLPVLSRDAIKAGLVETYGAETDAVRTTAVPRSFDLFFETIRNWLRSGVSLIAEHSFDWDMQASEIQTSLALARSVILFTDTSDEEAGRRFIARERVNPLIRPDRLAEAIESIERGAFDWRRYDLVEYGVPTLHVDTTEGYTPDIETLVSFCKTRSASP